MQEKLIEGTVEVSEKIEEKSGLETDESIHSDSSVHSRSTYTRNDTYTSGDNSSSRHTSTAPQYTEDFSTTTPHSPPHSTTNNSSHSSTSILPTDDEVVSIVEDQSDGSNASFKLVSAQLDVTKPTAPDSTPDVVLSSECEDLLSAFSIGQRVLVGGVQPGTLRFKGRTTFAPGYWGGIELDTNEGYNNGSKDGIAYFECAEKSGIFAPPEKISILPEGHDGDEQVLVEGSISSDISDHTLTETEDVSPCSHNIIDLLDTVTHSTTDQNKQDLKVPQEQPEVTNYKQVDLITDSLTKSVLLDAVNLISNISNAKQAKLEQKPTNAVETKPEDSVLDNTTSSLLTDAIGHMMNIRNQKREALNEKDMSSSPPVVIPGSITSGTTRTYTTEKQPELPTLSPQETLVSSNIYSALDEYSWCTR